MMFRERYHAYLPAYNPLTRKAAESLFVYLPFDKHGLADRQRDLVRELNLPGIKPTDLTKFHVTLVYVEACSDSTITEVLSEFRAPYRVGLEISSVEVLEGGEKPALVWMVNPDPGLVRLQSDLYYTLVDRVIGMSEFSDPKIWKPHITIAYDLPTVPARIPATVPFKLIADRFVVGRDEFRDIATVKLDGGVSLSKGFVEKLYSTELDEGNLYSILRGEKAVVGPLRRVLDLRNGPFSIRDEPSREKCMDCDRKPTTMFKWAEGMGLCWFCDEHAKAWKADHEDDIDYEYDLPDGIADKEKAVKRRSVDNLDVVKRGGEGSGHFGHAGRPGEVGGSAPGDGPSSTSDESFNARYPLAGNTVDGRVVREEVSNISSIDASLYKWEILDGIREVKFSEFENTKPSFYSKTEREKTERLAAGIKESGEIEPLIVVIDDEGLWVLEGGHRFDALLGLGAESFPALMVVDREKIPGTVVERGGHGSGHFTHDGRPGTVGGSTPGEGGPASWNEVAERASVMGATRGRITELKPGTTREQGQRFYDRRNAVNAANKFRYRDGNTAREVIDSKLMEGPATIRRERFYYEVTNRESGQSMRFTRSEECDYIDTLMNHGRFARNYELVERHLGPGPHPGGSEQAVRSGNGGGKSESKKETSAAAGASDPTAGSGGTRSPEALSRAQGLYAAATEAEPRLTPMMQSIAETVGGKLEGLDRAVKTEESLARKIDLDSAEKGISHEEAANNVTDANRYTMTLDSDNYVEGVLAAQQELEANGYVQYDTKWRNYFGSGDAYDGYNSVYIHQETGDRFEVQFHTSESLAIKSEVHETYKEFQSAPAGSPERLTAWERMQQAWQGYTKPAGWQSLPGSLIGVARSFFAKKRE